jgi:hypothetical protein
MKQKLSTKFGMHATPSPAVVSKEQHYFMIKGEYKKGEEDALKVLSIEQCGEEEATRKNPSAGGSSASNPPWEIHRP